MLYTKKAFAATARPSKTCDSERILQNTVRKGTIPCDVAPVFRGSCGQNRRLRKMRRVRLFALPQTPVQSKTGNAQIFRGAGFIAVKTRERRLDHRVHEFLKRERILRQNKR